MRIPFLIGRLIFGGFFLYSGINHFKNRRTVAQYARAKKVPLAEAAVVATGAALLFGGASVVAGIKPKLGTAAAMGFLAAVSPVMHDFWKQQDANQRQNELANFSKNMALLGAAMALMSVKEPWPHSLDQVKPLRRAASAVTRLLAA